MYLNLMCDFERVSYVQTELLTLVDRPFKRVQCNEDMFNLHLCELQFLPTTLESDTIQCPLFCITSDGESSCGVSLSQLTKKDVL